MKSKSFIFVMVATLCMTACSSDNDDLLKGFKAIEEEPVTRHSYTPVELNETQQAINAKLQEFSWKLFKEVYAGRNPGVNLMISPISLEVDLGMFINGLEGETLQEVLKTMGLEGFSKEQINDFFKTMMTGIEKADEAAIFRSANSFWYNKNKEVNKDFVSAIQGNYDAKAEAVDFSAPNTKDIINAWCAEKTENRIKKMVDETSDDDLFHLMNAVYFKSRWETVFSKKQTSRQPFNYADGTTADVDMMHRQYYTLYMENDSYQFGVNPFIDGSFQMIFILPKEGVDVADAIPSVVSRETLASFGKTVNLDLYVPKFTSEYTEEKLFPLMANINPSLKFQPEEFNVFTEPVEKIDMKSLQRTFFLMDEEGAEAAATSVKMGLGEAGTDPNIENKVMRLDRPFFYAIVESKTFCPLFIGYYGN